MLVLIDVWMLLWKCFMLMFMHKNDTVYVQSTQDTQRWSTSTKRNEHLYFFYIIKLETHDPSSFESVFVSAVTYIVKSQLYDIGSRSLRLAHSNMFVTRFKHILTFPLLSLWVMVYLQWITLTFSIKWSWFIVNALL